MGFSVGSISYGDDILGSSLACAPVQNDWNIRHDPTQFPANEQTDPHTHHAGQVRRSGVAAAESHPEPALPLADHEEEKKHKKVKLADSDLRRITLWLDCNSNFYGAYANTAEQLRGESVMPDIE